MRHTLKTSLVIIGSGGHGRELADVVEACIDDGRPWELLGFLDDDERRHGETVRGLPILGGSEWLRQHRDVRVVLGIGSPEVKRRVVEKLGSTVRYQPLVHPRAEVTRFVEIGPGVVITAGCVVTNEIKLGAHVHLNRNCTVGHDCVVGDYVHLAPGCVLSGNVHIEEGCDIGTSACVIQNLTVGAWTIVGAGAAVVRDLPAFATAVGVPARVIKSRLLSKVP